MSIDLNTFCRCGLPYEFHMSSEFPKISYIKTRGSGEYIEYNKVNSPFDSITLSAGDWDIVNPHTKDRYRISLIKMTQICNSFKMDNLKYLENLVTYKEDNLC